MVCAKYDCPSYEKDCPYNRESMKAALVCKDYIGSRQVEYERHVAKAKAAGRVPMSYNEYFNC